MLPAEALELFAVWRHAVRSYAANGQWRGVWLMFRHPVYLSVVCWYYLNNRGAWLEWRTFGAPLPSKGQR